MTSYIIDSHKTLKTASKWKSDATFCAFCRIIQDGAKAYKVYENENIIAILGGYMTLAWQGSNHSVKLVVIDINFFQDILPIRPGHVLVIPKAHYQRLSDLPVDVARATGEAVSKVANALTKGTTNHYSHTSLCVR